MNKSQATGISVNILTLIQTVISARNDPSNNMENAQKNALSIKYDLDELKKSLIEATTSEPTTNPAESCTCRAIDIPAADPTREIRPTSSTHWQTKDCAMLHTDKFYALWYCDSITGEILRMNGCLRHDGKLVELAGMDSASIDIGELYFWRVNLLKDELAAQSTSTVVEVEYSDNAEMEVETSPEYD